MDGCTGVSDLNAPMMVPNVGTGLAAVHWFASCYPGFRLWRSRLKLWGRRASDDRDDDTAGAGFDVALEVKDLLPGSEEQLAVGQGDGNFRAECRRLQVGMAVAVMPGLFVSVGFRRRHQPIQQFRQVPLETGFEFDRSNDSGAADVEHVNRTLSYSGFPHNPLDLPGNIMHVPVTFCLQLDLSSVNHR